MLSLFITCFLLCLWVAVGISVFIYLHKKLCISEFTCEDLPAAIIFGGVSGPFGLLVVVATLVIEKISSKE